MGRRTDGGWLEFKLGGRGWFYADGEVALISGGWFVMMDLLRCDGLMLCHGLLMEY